MLSKFISEHREEVLVHARERMKASHGVVPNHATVGRIMARFVDELAEHVLRDDSARGEGFSRLGAELGASLEPTTSAARQAVCALGGVCDAVTAMAIRDGVDVSTKELRAMNSCIDSSVAAAVAGCSERREDAHERLDLELVGALAHELRNTLTSATFAFHMIRSGKASIGDRAGDLLGRALGLMGLLVERALVEVRIDADLALRPERLLVMQLLLEVQDIVHPTAVAKRVDVSLRSDDGLDLEADRQLVVSALSNLLLNAVKYTRVRGKVAIRAAALGDRVVFEIEDECGGLPGGAPHEIFTPFVQKHADKSGLGLGLSIVRRSVEAHGGAISVKDLPCKGCIFRVDLPRHRPS